MSDAAAPAPYTWLTLSAAPANGAFQLYILDADGRKIALVWGSRDERRATAALFAAAPAMRDALLLADSLFETGAGKARGLNAGDLWDRAHASRRAALALLQVLP